MDDMNLLNENKKDISSFKQSLQQSYTHGFWLRYVSNISQEKAQVVNGQGIRVTDGQALHSLKRRERNKCLDVLDC